MKITVVKKGAVNVKPVLGCPGFLDEGPMSKK
jgi:hypothetical protein